MKKIVEAPIVADLPYSAGVIAVGLCFVAGQFGTDAENHPVGGVEEQTILALDHIAAVLARAGSGLPHVVRTTVWLRSLDDFAAMNRAYRTRFAQDPPARVTIQVAALLFGAAVEIDAIAIVPAT
ncbi:MAG: RidA family protein [Chloroflexota bacterium]|nr:RidA family protein [Chloroflexota bacterium]